MTAEKQTFKKSPLKEFFVKYFSIITLLVAVLITAFGGWFVLKPKYEEVSLSGALNIKTRQEELQDKKDFLKQLQQLQNNYQNLRDEDIINIKLSLPSEEDVQGIFVQLENLANISGFNLLSVDVSAPENMRELNSSLKNIKKINIAATVEGGNYSALKSLLREIELNMRLLDIESLNFTSGSNLYTLNMSTYYYDSVN